MKHLYYIAFFVVFLQFTVRAQSSFKPGYIISAKGDTTKGLVNYKQWSQNHEQLIFKKDATAAETNYTKDTAPAFGVEGYGNYRLFSVKLRQYTSAPDDEINFSDTLYINKNVYLAEVVIGKKVSLYSYDDGKKTNLFIAEGNSAPRELVGYMQFNYDSFSKIDVTDAYKKQLVQLTTTYLPGNTILPDAISRISYKVNDIKPIVIAINGSNDVIYVEKLRKHIRFFAGAGLNATGIYFDSPKHIYEPLGYVWSYAPQLNLGLDIFDNINSRWMFRGDINFSTSNHEFVYTNQSTHGIYGPYTYITKNIIKRFSVNFNPQALFNVVNANDLKVFIAGGVRVELAFYPENSTTATATVPMPVGAITTVRVFTQSVYYGFNGKAGVTIKRFQIYGNYNSPQIIQSYDSKHAVRLASFNFGVNYLF